jgi:oligoribonuclease (3'-5' exoribonuclease)
MKMSNEVVVELKKLRAAIDDMYDKLNTTLYKKNLGAKVSYSEVKPFDSVSENFEYISKIVRDLQDSEIIGEE